MIETLHDGDDERWLALRLALWPHGSADEHRVEMREQASDPQCFVALLWTASDGRAEGLAEASLRHEYVHGTASSPVGYLEGLYVVPSARRHGVAGHLVRRIEAWARERNCRELASDAALDNAPSRAMHRALGFDETERVVFFRKGL